MKNGVPDKRAAEKISSNLSRLLQGQNFESEEQARNCILFVYPLAFDVITSYKAKSFKMLAPNPGGAAKFCLCLTMAKFAPCLSVKISKRFLRCLKQGAIPL